jgi:electron transport complex protein RnfC
LLKEIKEGLFMASSFKGGVHPPDKKEYAKDQPVKKMPLPKMVTIPLQQHIGAPAKPTVNVGDEVKTGQIIGEPGGFISAYVHSTITGKVVSIDSVPYIMGGKKPAIKIERTSDEDDWVLLENYGDYTKKTKEEIVDLVKRAGIVGMGGAMFPTHVKLTPPKDKKVDTLIINGVECEPYLNSDNRLMIEKSDDLVKGILILKKALDVDNVYIGIEDNKPIAIDKMLQAVNGTGIKIVKLKTKYPQGGEKQLINAITGRKVPPAKLPADVGVVVQNTSTAYAVFEAVEKGIPLIQRIVTVSGEAIANPGNVLARFGTPIKDLIEFHGGFTMEEVLLFFGGPMTGIIASNTEFPVLKGNNGVTAIPFKDYQENPCINCGGCVKVCPMNLVPATIVKMAKAKQFKETKEYNVMDCIECGSCAYTCPAKIPLVYYIKLAKKLVKIMK